MNVAMIAAIAVAVVGGGYGIHGLATETGAVGWLIYAQQSIFGSASMKLTFMIVFVTVMLLTIATYALIPSRDAPTAGDSNMSKALYGDPASPTPLKTLAVWTLAFIPLVWMIGYGVYWWAIYGDRSDITATYEQVALTDARSVPSPKGPYVALNGRAMGDTILQHTEGRSSSSIKYYLVPVVASDWTKGQPVHFLMKVKQLDNLGIRPAGAPAIMRGSPYDKAAQAARFGWLGHLEGAPPVPAVQAFKNLGVALSDGAQLVRWIPSQGGKPAIQDSSDEYRSGLYIICGAITAMLMIVALAWWWKGGRQQKKVVT